MKGYLTNEEAEKKYGKEMLKKMDATGMLKGITCRVIDGVIYTPESDYHVAWKVATGKPVSWTELD